MWGDLRHPLASFTGLAVLSSSSLADYLASLYSCAVCSGCCLLLALCGVACYGALHLGAASFGALQRGVTCFGALRLAVPLLVAPSVEASVSLCGAGGRVASQRVLTSSCGMCLLVCTFVWHCRRAAGACLCCEWVAQVLGTCCVRVGPCVTVTSAQLHAQQQQDCIQLQQQQQHSKGCLGGCVHSRQVARQRETCDSSSSS
jgi:hypothetical protein